MIRRSKRFASVLSFSLVLSTLIGPQASADYYTISDSTLKSSTSIDLSPENQIRWWQETLKESLSLLGFERHSAELAEPNEPYNRRKHFIHWIKRDGCKNTRMLVLERDSTDSVEYGDNCRVISGNWEDPYSGQTFTSAAKVDIDHVVALQNAYNMGAWKWTSNNRCLYANYTANDFHLMAVSQRENSRKGAKAPDEYVPPNKDYICPYLKNWLYIKMIWKLALTDSEVNRVKDLVEEYSCSTTELSTPVRSLADERKKIQSNQKLCEKSLNETGD